MLPLPLLFLCFLPLLQLLLVLEKVSSETLSTRIVMLCHVLLEVLHTLEVIVVVITGAKGTLLQQEFGVLLISCN
jgi:hypothetical protein